jgi:hypothetical protein
MTRILQTRDAPKTNCYCGHVIFAWRNCVYRNSSLFRRPWSWRIFCHACKG